MDKLRILVIDDQYGRWESQRRSFLNAVTDKSVRVAELVDFTFCSGQHAGRNSIPVVENAVRERWFGAVSNDTWSLVLLDIRFEEEDGASGAEFGLQVLEHLREQFGRHLPIVMLTREDGEEARRLSNRRLADGFLHKQGLSASRLAERLLTHGLFPDVRRLLYPEGQSSSDMVGSSLPFLLTLREARRVALQSRDAFLVLGETGTGKTELAGFIHDHSERRRRRFKKWTAEGLREDLMKDALFGHWKGAHSLAMTSEPGEIEKTDGGTFFVDEIASLTPSVQELFLELRRRDGAGQRTLTRLGTFPSAPTDARQAKDSVIGTLLPNHAILIDVALIAATNRRIDAPDTHETAFRRDLLNAFGEPLVFPALNARRSDIVPLFSEFVARGRGNRPFAIDPAVKDALESYDWSEKNIVVLKAMAERAAYATADFDEILPHHLPDLFDEKAPRLVTRVEPIATQDDTGGDLQPSYAELTGLLRHAQIDHVRRALRLFGAALRATKKKDGRTTTLDALCMLLDVPRVAAAPRAQSKKSYDILRQILGMAEINCNHRAIADCLKVSDESISVSGENGTTIVLTTDSVVIKHVRQALASRR